MFQKINEVYYSSYKNFIEFLNKLQFIGNILKCGYFAEIDFFRIFHFFSSPLEEYRKNIYKAGGGGV